MNEDIVAAIGQCSQVTKLKIRFLIDPNCTIIPSSLKITKLKILEFIGIKYDIQIRFLKKLLDFNPNLEDLTLKDVEVSNEEFENILKLSLNLTAFSVETYELSEESLLLVPHYLKNLTHLSLNFHSTNSPATEDVCNNLLSNLPKLKQFSAIDGKLTLTEVSFNFR